MGKKFLSRIIVLLLATAMIVGVMASTVIGGELTAADMGLKDVAVFSENEDEADVGEGAYTLMTTSNGVFPVSEETAAVVESLEEGNYAENELLIIYEDEEDAAVAAEVLPEVSEDVAQAEIIVDSNTVKITLDEGTSMEEQIIELSAEEGVAYVQPNYRYELSDEEFVFEVLDDAAFETVSGISSVNTNDPYKTQQLYLDHVNIQQAWNKVLAANYGKVRVAILDTGALVSHQDLTGSIIKSLCVDVTGSTYYVTTSDPNGHGTQVSSMIGATANDGVGIVGAATCGLTGTNSPLEYFSVDVFEGSGGYSDDIAKGIRYAMDNGAKVINMSLGYAYNETTWTDTVFKNAVDDAWAANVICVGASGNDNNSTPHWPSDYEKVIAVNSLSTMYLSNYTACDRGSANYRRSSFSCYNVNKDICAPGSYDYGAYKNSTTSYVFMSGTSQATPIVTSVIALMFMVNPNLTFDQVYNIITSTATDMVYTQGYADDSQNPTLITENAGVGFDVYTGYGLINAEACVDAALVNWEFDSSKGILYIYSDNAMADYAEGGDVPWSDYLSQITSIVIQNGVTKIGSRCFANCTNLATVNIPATVATIGANAFNGCTSLTRVNYGATSADRADITIGTGNTALTNATWKYTPCEHNGATHVSAQAATCTADGNIEYWHCGLCDKYFSDAAFTTEITQAQTVIKAGHVYTTSPEWQWTGFTAAKAKFKCNNCTHVEEVTATITSEVTQQPKCTTSGKTKYTATAVFGGTTYSTTNIDTTQPAATGHDYTNVVPEWNWTGYVGAKAKLKCNNCTHVEEVAANITNVVTKQATCYASGETTYTAKATLNSVTYEDTKVDTTKPAKLEHDYSGVEPTWDWTGFTAAKAKFKCKNCTNVQEINANITSAVTQQPTCTAPGRTTYTATVIYLGITYTADEVDDTKPVKLEHDYTGVTPTWDWTGYTAAKAKFKCKNCTHKEEVTATITNEVTKPATCTVPGETTYKATVNFKGTNHETTKVDTTQPAASHALEHHARWEATFDKEGNKEYWYCTTCKKYFTDGEGKNETTWADLVLPKMAKPLVDEMYDDVFKTDWFYDNVAFVYARQIMTGMGGTKHFAPYDQLHREQFAVMLHRLEGCPPVAYESRFPDVPDGTWYTAPIIWAYNNGIITGYQSGYFGVGDSITREQLAVMLYRYADKYKKLDVSTKADISKFVDAASVSSWAQDAIKWAVANKIITGKDNGTRIDPQGNAARCECAAMFQRFMEKYGL